METFAGVGPEVNPRNEYGQFSHEKFGAHPTPPQEINLLNCSQSLLRESSLEFLHNLQQWFLHNLQQKGTSGMKVLCVSHHLTHCVPVLFGSKMILLLLGTGPHRLVFLLFQGRI